MYGHKHLMGSTLVVFQAGNNSEVVNSTSCIWYYEDKRLPRG